MNHPITENTLFYGDNLPILREYIPDESVDLVYLDPPFNSNRSYNVLFSDESGEEAPAQIEAFEDTWHWSEAAEQTYFQLITEGSEEISRALSALREILGTSQVMAYLVMMAARLVELHRVLKPTGSLYLHCDPTSSHYLKVVMDTIFGPANFRNEIVWRRTGSNNTADRFGPIHQIILFYGKTKETSFYNPRGPYTRAYVKESFTQEDARGRYQSVALTGPGTRQGDSGKPWRSYDPTSVGRHWQPASYVYWKYFQLTGQDLAQWPLLERLAKLDEAGLIHWGKKQGSVPRYKYYINEAPGVPLQDIWAFQPGTEGCVHGQPDKGIDEEVKWISSKDSERLGYPTQKPLSLLERIIEASSEPGDIVLDPFCGCGTTVVAAHKLERHWIGIDITHLSIALQRNRLKESYPDASFKVIGEPEDIGAAQQLASEDRYQFQWWALSLVDAKPLGQKGKGKTGKKGADKGIDGSITFLEAQGKPQRVLVQVKSGKVSVSDIRDLVGTIDREGAAIGVFITLDEPTSPMRKEAASAGFYSSPGWGGDYPRIQILTINELLHGAQIKMPPKGAGPPTLGI